MKKRYPVLMIGNFLSGHSRSRSVCEDLAERLAGAGWEVFITSKKIGRLERIMDMFGVVWLKRKEYSVATIDVFSGLSFFWAEMTAMILRILKKPYILTLHGGNLPQFSKRCPYRVTRLLRFAAAVTVPSNYLLEQMKPYRTDLLLLPNPIDIKKYQFIPRNQPRPLLMWLRGFEDIYNPPLAVQTVNHLISSHPSLKLSMAGGDLGNGVFEKVKELAGVLGVSNFVELTGGIPKNEVPRWLQRGDIFINTTNADNTPISVLEAMACGLCVVSTNVGGIPYLIENEKDGLLVHPNDPERMAQTIHRILTEPGLSRRLSENARQKVEQFDWALILPQWEYLIDTVVENQV